ncbi:uncharacterized protein LOC131673605 [Phymastichus coffea]|uniref:uncharacterized protein LOC131673605 n=1 Tax=Phymastichus coffea TaxID=108790 RepID=UPI00273C9090|nr:uncharacterized protein LOC131673605 [Phymastichus coffea]
MTESPRITLILDGRRFQVDKRRIIDKSRYFHSLFSHNFSDSKANEQTVLYNFDPIVIQDFCDWVEEDPPHALHDESHQIKISLQKYLSDSYLLLKQFVELSIIYSVDELSVELSDIIVQHWLKPTHLLDIWRMSRELSLTALTNVTFAACLERFVEIPTDELLSLPLVDFLKLAANININCQQSYLLSVIDKRSQMVVDNREAQEKLARLQQLLRSLERQAKTMQCFFVETYKALNVRELHTKTIYAFHEGQSPRFSEVVEVWRVDDSGKDLAGVGLVGRGFSVYKIGGELRLGSCKFNMNIWRYCLISRKWYYLARLRKARRHMVAAIVDNKLILIGGVSRYRLKTNSVEVLDLHTSAWTRAPDIAESFTDTPPSCVIDGVIIICISSLYMFNGHTNTWLSVKHDIDPVDFCSVRCLACYKNTLFIGKEGGEFTDYSIAWTYAEDASIRAAFVIRSSFVYKSFHSACEKIHIDDRGKLSGIVYEAKKVIVESGTLGKDPHVKFSMHDFNFPGGGSLAPISCFNLTDPASLYMQVVE